MLSAKIGHFLDRPLSPLARRIPLSPNTLTVIGFLITTAAAAVLPFHLLAGGLLILLGGFFDLMDGVVARTRGRKSAFGAFLDSTLDRYSDGFIFCGIGWYFLSAGDVIGLGFTAAALLASLIISYVRARAGALGIDCHVGLIERPERIVLVSFGCLTDLIFPVIVVLCILSHVTVVQRIMHVYRISGQYR